MNSELWLKDAHILTNNESEPVIVLKNNDTVIGRDVELSDICLLDEGISRQHILFSRKNYKWFVRDLDSTNGTFLNGRKIPSGSWHLLRNQDLLQISDIKFGIDLKVDEVDNFDNSVLHVFSGLNYLGEYNATVPGNIFSLIKRGENFQLSREHPEFPGIQFVLKDSSIVSINIDSNYSIDFDISSCSYEKQAEFNDALELGDRDFFSVGSYQVVFENPKLSNLRRNTLDDDRTENTDLEISLAEKLSHTGISVGLKQNKDLENNRKKIKEAEKEAGICDSLVTLNPMSVSAGNGKGHLTRSRVKIKKSIVENSLIGVDKNKRQLLGNLKKTNKQLDSESRQSFYSITGYINTERILDVMTWSTTTLSGFLFTLCLILIVSGAVIYQLFL